MSLFSFVVPLEWTGDRWAAGSEPSAWLAANGKSTTRPPPTFDETTDPSEPLPVRFTFRLDATMADLIKIERRVDEVNEGIGETVDLDSAIDRLWRSMRQRFEAEVWPDGRPKAMTTEDDREQERLIDQLYLSPDNDRERLILNRMHMMRDRQRVAAEWSIMIVGPPDGWADIATKPLRPGVAEAIALAYMDARQKATVASGK